MSEDPTDPEVEAFAKSLEIPESLLAMLRPKPRWGPVQRSEGEDNGGSPCFDDDEDPSSYQPRWSYPGCTFRFDKGAQWYEVLAVHGDGDRYWPTVTLVYKIRGSAHHECHETGEISGDCVYSVEWGPAARYQAAPVVHYREPTSGR
jgi:hypothetical protein